MAGVVLWLAKKGVENRPAHEGDPILSSWTTDLFEMCLRAGLGPVTSRPDDLSSAKTRGSGYPARQSSTRDIYYQYSRICIEQGRGLSDMISGNDRSLRSKEVTGEQDLELNPQGFLLEVRGMSTASPTDTSGCEIHVPQRILGGMAMAITGAMSGRAGTAPSCL
ncbi:uncharacterized protein BO80DRAFT_468341 [Aspergillus ibericus CBS 121593]|uniref:Uncharacterized protein n=1 Tax=Aspergillus ibericus CBS 121593 TaxID=1448316 RepID=A0A395GNA2_9EURO|nr:hypothetical protein BO80DRAFT_468341 [Aspergillus ibericus CBS 121593]RAK96832.1 hypothetical protein BO80DRAFT_468341 [Aspergillus ibericus CBS 121593]